MAKFTLVKETPAAVRSNSGGRAAEDIREMAETLRKHPTQTLRVEAVWNPGRYYDGLRKHGFVVKVRATGETAKVERKGETKEYPLFDVYASVAAEAEA